MADKPARKGPLGLPVTADPLFKSLANASSGQMGAALSFHQSEMIDIFCAHAPHAKDFVAQCLALVPNKRRKVTSMNREEATKLLFWGMFGSPEYAARSLKALDIERDMLIRAVTSYIDEGLDGTDPARRHMAVILSDYIRLRTLIMARYTRLMYRNASFYTNTQRMNGQGAEIDDSFQNMVMAALRAIDKFSASAGTLTTYVAGWLRNAHHSMYSAPLGAAFTIPRGEKARIHQGTSAVNNMSLSLEDALGVPDQDDGKNMADLASPEELERVHKMVALLKSQGKLTALKWGFIVSSLPYTLSEEQIEALKKANPFDTGDPC